MIETLNEKRTRARRKKPRMMLAPRSPKVAVDVQAKTINEAIVRNSSHCMIAEAVKLAVPYADHVSVDLQSIRFTDKERGLRYSYLTPRQAQLAIIEFDQGRRPKPFKIELHGGAVRRAVQKPRKSDVTPSLDERLAIIQRFQSARTERELSLQDIADSIDIAPRSLERYVSANPPVFSGLVAEKLNAWVENRRGPGRPHAVPASLVSGRPRLRNAEKGPRNSPEVVGGKAPPIGNIARRRGFGLRQMVV